METHGTRFDEYLEETSAIADSFGRISALVLMRLGFASSDRQREFEEWLSRMLFTCSRCGHFFSHDGRAIDEAQAIACPSCARDR